MKKAVFFDRDGIVNVPPVPGGYVEHPDHFRVMPEFIESLRVVNDCGYEALVITNQQGVGKGLYSERVLAEIHAKLMAEVERHGLCIRDLFYCPHLAADRCACRKPKPGMLLRAAEKWGIDLQQSWMVGDSFSDVEAGDAAGCRTLLVNPEAYGKATKWVGSIGEMPAAIREIVSTEVKDAS
jgi:D-glycero-D-manno-heptose 1,7-bisphosphate phosphatase